MLCSSSYKLVIANIEVLKNLASKSIRQLSALLKLKDRLYEIDQVCFRKNYDQYRYKYLYFRYGQIILSKIKFLVPTKSSLSFSLTTHLLCLVDVFFSQISTDILVGTTYGPFHLNFFQFSY